MSFMLSLFGSTIPTQLLFLLFFLFDRSDPETIDEYIDERGNDNRVEGSSDIERNENIAQIFLEPFDGHLDSADTFAAEYEIAGQILHIVHRRHCDGIAQPNHRDRDRDIEFDQRGGGQHSKHLHRHRDKSPKESYQYCHRDRPSVDREILPGNLVFVDQLIDLAGTLFVFVEDFSYHWTLLFLHPIFVSVVSLNFEMVLLLAAMTFLVIFV